MSKALSHDQLIALSNLPVGSQITVTPELRTAFMFMAFSGRSDRIFSNGPVRACNNCKDLHICPIAQEFVGESEREIFCCTGHSK